MCGRGEQEGEQGKGGERWWGGLSFLVSLLKLSGSVLLSLAAHWACGFYWGTLGLAQRLGKAPAVLGNGGLSSRKL